MKTNVNLFIALVLCAVMGGLLYFLVRPAQDDLGWNPNEMYGELGARSYDGSSFTNATLSGASNGGVALSMPHTSFSLRTRVSPITYGLLPISNSQSPIANSQSPISQSPISYTTSSAEYRSFGGGGNGNIGSAGTFRASAQSPIAHSQSPIAYTPSPIAYTPSPNSLLASSPNSPIAPSPISNTPATVASGSNPAGLFSYALQTSYGTASYDAMNYYANNGNRINNRFNAPPGTSGEEGDDEGSTYESWLEWMYRMGWQFGKQDDNEDNAWVFGDKESYNAFLTWYYLTYGKEYSPTDPTTPPEFTYEQWMEWFKANGSSHYHHGFAFYYTPIGDLWSLLVVALIYVGCTYFRRRKTIQ